MKVAILSKIYSSNNQPIFVKLDEEEMKAMDPDNEGFVPSFFASFPDSFSQRQKEQLTNYHYDLMKDEGDEREGH